MSIALFLHRLATCAGLFVIMTIFMIVAIITAKKKTAWIWYAGGAVFQLLSLLGNQKSADYYGESIAVEWIIYFVLLIIFAILIVDKHNKSLSATKNTNCSPVETRNKSLGWKWFFFYTRIRPFLACSSFFALSVVDFVKYTDVYLNNFWFMLNFIGAIVQVVLCVMVFIKSFGDYREFVSFVYAVLLFETFYIPYQQGVLQYAQNKSDFIFPFVMVIIVFIPAYFLWYRLNVKYFEKRISHLTSFPPKKSRNPEPYKSRFTECPKCGYIAVFEKKCPKCDFILPTEVQEENSSESPKILYCRKCGEKILEEAKFCKECGTEIITKQ